MQLGPDVHVQRVVPEPVLQVEVDSAPRQTGHCLDIEVNNRVHHRTANVVMGRSQVPFEIWMGHEPVSNGDAGVNGSLDHEPLARL
jgi:hypothetical protein